MFSSPSNTRIRSHRRHAARSANRFEALEPIQQEASRFFGSIAPGVARGLKLRHDHGSNYMSSDFQDKMESLGIEASPSFSSPNPEQWRRRALHPNIEGDLLWVPNVRSHRGTARRARRIRQALQ